MPRTVNFKNVGPPNTPEEIKRLRRENADMCRRMGQPIVFRHIYGQADVDAGIAKTCPACYDSAYKQTRSDCPVCYGVGLVSVANNDANLYITQDGEVVQTVFPEGGWVLAPQYGGFAVPYLQWMMEPDIAVDTFKINDAGVLEHTYDATGVAPWFPTLGDNDLCINVDLNSDGFTIAETLDRFQLKRVQQITIRGFGRRTLPSTNGQPLLVSQTFQMNKIPTNSHLYDVPTDEPWY